ncbi:MAG: hypothetical protein C5B43_00045 [Verrucomicrobia bacterium]|nr:MAG: hypothetical protein C5B43_00045 [Verrucomicrobiota bacterium]
MKKNPDLKKIFQYDLDPSKICRDLRLALNKKIEAKKTLLFIDEIQEEPRAITALRYFYEEMPELHVIAAGSLVDFAIDQVGIPVGRIEFLYMYPMSFMEYLAAKGEKNLAIELVNHPPEEAINEAVHIKTLKLLGPYMAIGGMPAAMSQWIAREDIELCGKVLKNIKNAYEQDFSKYSKTHEIKYVELLFKQIPSIICEHFRFSNLATHFKKRDLEPSLHLLEKAGIVNQIVKSVGDGIPLGAQADFNKFKLMLHDVGLTQAILGLDLKDWFIDPEAALINKGRITESFVGQELLAYSNASDKHRLYYWHREKRGAQAEVDYLIPSKHKIIPVKITNRHGASLQSLRQFLETHPQSDYGIRLSIHNYSVIQDLKSFPLYAVAGIVDNKERILEFLSS